jgi:SOS response regulatory protein OraA/RecX
VSVGRASIAVPASHAEAQGLAEGSEIDSDALLETAASAQLAPLEQDMARYLAAAERHTSRLRSYLLRRRYLPSLVDQAVRRAVSLGWVDDARFAALAVRGRAGRGRARIVADLVARGVQRSTAAEAAAGVDEDAELESLLPLLRRKYSGLDGRTALRRATGFLVRRGFPAGKSWKAASRALGQPGEGDR